MRVSLLCFFIAIISPISAQAFYFDFNAFYMSDGITYTSTTTHGRTLFDTAIGIGLGKRSKYFIAWSFASMTATDTDSVETTFSSTDMGLRFGGYFNKAKTFSMTLTYNLIVTSSFQTAGGATEEWRGSSIMSKLGYHIPVGEESQVAIRLNYYSNTASERILGGTTLSTVSYATNFIYPSVAYVITF